MNRSITTFLLGAVLLVAFSFSGCKKETIIQHKISEGKIIFDISFPPQVNPQVNPQSFSSVIPSQMVILFKENSTYTKIKGPLNFFSLDVVKPYKKDSITTYLRVLDKKVSLTSPARDGNFLFSELQNKKTTLIDGLEKEICGIKCKKALLSDNDDAIAPIEIYYTNLINIKNPNSNGPFNEIPGVMLKFDITVNKIRYTFTASDICEEKIEDSFFKPLKGYQKITQEEMQDLMRSLTQ